MTEVAADAQSVERISEFGSNPAGLARRWKTEITLAKKDRKKWFDANKKIMKRYRDERSEKDGACRFNVMWSNVQTLGPAIYAKVPKAVVERRFLDRDPIGRTACRILERTLMYQIEVGKFHGSVRLARDDYLLTAQGVNRVRYEPTYKQGLVATEKTCVDYVHWSDYLCSPARVEDEVTWKAFRAFMTREQMEKRFKSAAKFIKYVPLDHVPNGMSSEDANKPENELLKKATVWEIWDKSSGKVIFLAEDYTESPLEVVDDPLSLDGFWPTPNPMVGTTTNDTVIPVPDYHLYKDQARELDDLTNRIALLTDAIRASGAYDASFPELGRLLEDGGENKLFPVDQWAAFAEKGGMIGAISFLPIKEMAEVLIRLYEARQQVKNDLYEITGISDIVRGFSSGAQKTATEQRIKGNFANLRLTDRQAEMARFARDTLAIMAEIIAEHFSDDTIRQMSGYDQWGVEEQIQAQKAAQPQQPMAQPGQPPMAPPVPQGGNVIPMPQADPMEIARQKADEQFAAAIKLLRDEKLRGFRIDIETDSTIEPDQQMEKQARVEFLTAAGQFIGQSLEVGMTAPDLIPLMGKMMLFGVRGFRAGRELETAFEETIAKLEQQAAQPKEAKPSPEEMKAQVEMQKMQMEMQAREQELQAEAQRTAADRQMQAEQQAMEMEYKREEHRMKMEEMVRKSQIEVAKFDLDMQKMRAGVALDQQKRQDQAAMQDRQAQLDAQKQYQQAAMDQQSLDRQADFDDRSMQRQEQADRNKAALASQQMQQKAKM